MTKPHNSPATLALGLATQTLNWPDMGPAGRGTRVLGHDDSVPARPQLPGAVALAHGRPPGRIAHAADPLAMRPSSAD